MTTHIARCLLPGLLLLPAGCLEFDAQEVVLRHDPEQDRIDVLLLYRGLYAEQSGDEEKLKAAIDDLDKALQTGEFAFWNNWPASCDLTADHQPPVRALLAHVDVENGTLFTDPKGQLCGYQFVRVRNASQFLQKLETLLEAALAASLVTGFDGRGGDHRADDDTKDLVREFLRSGEKLLVVSGNRIELRLPCSPADLGWVLDQIEQHFLRNVAREMVQEEQRILAKEAAAGDGSDRDIRMAALQRAPSFRFFWDNPFSIERRPDLTVLALGVAGAEELRLHKRTEREYDDVLLRALRERGDEIEDGTPDQEIERRFAAFHGRDAVLPPKLLAQRQK